MLLRIFSENLNFNIDKYYFIINFSFCLYFQGVSYDPSSEKRTPTALENRDFLDLNLYYTDAKMNWDDDAMVTEFNKKKFLFDYVADMLKGT